MSRKDNIYFASNETVDSLIEENKDLEKELFKISLKNYVSQLEENNANAHTKQVAAAGILICGIIFIGLLIAYGNS